MTRRMIAGGLSVKPTPPPINDQNLMRNPFNHLSAHHRPIGTGAVYSSSSDPRIVMLGRINGGTLNGNNHSGNNVFMNSASDPLKTITHNPSDPGAGYGPLPITVRTPMIRNPYPTGDESTGDRVVTLFDTTQNPWMILEFYKFMWNNGDPMTYGLRTYPANGSNNCTIGGPRFGNSASGLNCIWGEVRGAEIASGKPFYHTQQLTLQHTPFDAWALKVVWPAGHTDKITDWKFDGPIAYGQLFAIPPDTPRPAGLSDLGNRLFNQFRDYGIRSIDGGPTWRVRCDQDTTTAMKEEYNAQFDPGPLKGLLRVVLNDAENQTASGGGSPLSINSAFDA